ncbi:hypothetical protein [Desulfotomaculum sp. 1211_IL3151]|uniref:hypothetical protein n=1 Tax=Desulfotomaculum sp. 1211_IL3151 TaxID=3084055 RepID=UPI002FD98CFC
MATVSTALKLFDQFSQPLQQVVNQVNSAVSAMGRLHSALQVPVPPPVTLTVDMAGAMQEVERFKAQVRSTGSSAIQVVIDSQDITQKITQIQNQIRSGLTDTAIRVTFDTAAALQAATRIKGRIESLLTLAPINVRLNLNAASLRTQINSALRGLGASGITVQVRLDAANVLRQASALRAQIVSRIGTITAQLNLTLPDSLTNLLTGLQRLVTQLIAAIERLRLPPGGGGGGGGGSGGGTAGWLSNLKGIAAAYLSIAGAQKLLSATIGGAMEQQKMMDMFIARTGDAQIGTAMFERFKADALAAGQDVNKSLQSTLSFFSATQNTDQLTKLNNLAQRLNAFDSAGNGIEGAAFALKEAMSGDIVSLAERFNMSKSDIRAFKIDELGKSGDMDGFIKAFDKLLEKQRMGQEAFETMMKSPAKQMEIFSNNVKSAFADAGGAAVKGLLPAIIALNAAFQAGKFQTFFDTLSVGLSWIVQAGIVAFSALQQASEIVRGVLYNLGIVLLGLSPILLGVAAAIGVYLAYTKMLALWATIMEVKTRLWAAAQAALNFVMNMNPILRIIMLIIGLVTAIATLIAMTNGIKQVFADAFGFAVDVAEAAIKKIISLINGAIKGINKVAGFFGNLLGVEAKQIQEIEFKADFDKFKQAGQDMIKDFSMDKLKSKMGLDITNSLNQGVLDKWDAAAGGIPKVDKVGEVGKIKDKIDISSEDLKVMRDLAEFKNIQNFVTLTPTVQVTTGDIHQEVDVNRMLRRIEDAMAREIAQGAEGIYR